MTLVLHNVRIVPSNVRKNKGTSECDKSVVTYDIDTTQCENDIIKREKKIREPLNVTKVQSHVMLVIYNVREKIRKPPNVIKVQSHVMLVLHNVRMILSNVRKK